MRYKVPAIAYMRLSQLLSSSRIKKNANKMVKSVYRAE